MAAILLKKTKKKETLLYTSKEKVFTALYWLCKQEIAHRKLISLISWCRKSETIQKAFQVQY